MPLSMGQAVAIALRLRRLGSIEDLAARLAPTPESARPIPPEVPAVKDPGPTGRDRRLEFLRARGVEMPNLAGRLPQVDPTDLRGNIEQFIGKGPSKRTEDQLKQVRRYCDGIRKPHALPGEKGYL